MLPDFPNTKSMFWKRIRTGLRETLHSQGILSVIKENPIHEGDRTSTRDGDKSKIQSPHAIGQELEIDKDRLIKEGAPYVTKVFLRTSEHARAEVSKQLFEHIETSSREAGTALDAGGKPFDFEMYLGMLNCMEIQFDAEGKARLPTLVTGSTRITKLVQGWNQDPECINRIEEIVNEKRKVWFDRESNRKLVD